MSPNPLTRPIVQTSPSLSNTRAPLYNCTTRSNKNALSRRWPERACEKNKRETVRDTQSSCCALIEMLAQSDRREKGSARAPCAIRGTKAAGGRKSAPRKNRESGPFALGGAKFFVCKRERG